MYSQQQVCEYICKQYVEALICFGIVWVSDRLDGCKHYSKTQLNLNCDAVESLIWRSKDG